MSNNRLEFNIPEFIKELREMPNALRAEAAREVRRSAETAANSIRAEYGKHRRTGHLQDSVKVQEQTSGEFGVSVRVYSTDPIATIAEVGTQVRHTHAGWNRGASPPMHIFIPRVIFNRRAMYGRIKAMMERLGLVVTGEP